MPREPPVTSATRFFSSDMPKFPYLKRGWERRRSPVKRRLAKNEQPSCMLKRFPILEQRLFRPSFFQRSPTMPFDATLTLVGGPTVLIELAGLRFLTDPTFDAPGLYQGGVVLEKLTAPALTAEQVGAVDVVLLSHDQHFDN